MGPVLHTYGPGRPVGTRPGTVKSTLVDFIDPNSFWYLRAASFSTSTHVARLGEQPHSHGSPLCQDTFWGSGLGSLVAGPGVACPKSRCWGCEPVALESESSPRCPPGPVLAR